MVSTSSAATIQRPGFFAQLGSWVAVKLDAAARWYQSSSSFFCPMLLPGAAQHDR
jgi:hypothetical protein